MNKLLLTLKYIHSHLTSVAKRAFYMSFLLFVLVTTLRILSPILFAWIISDLQNLKTLIVWAIAIYASLFFFIRFLEEVRLAQYVVFEQEIQKSLLLRTMDKFFKVPFSSKKYASPSENAIAIEKGAGGIRDILYSFLFTLAPTSIEFVVMLIIIGWKTNITIAFFIGIILIAFISLTAFVSNKIRLLQEQWFQRYYTTHKILSEGLRSYETVRSFEQVDWVKQRYTTAINHFIEKVLESMKLNIVLGFLQGILLTLLIVTTLKIVLSLEMPLSTQITTLVLINGLLLQVMNPLLNFAGSYRVFMHGLASAEKLLGLLNEPEYPLKLQYNELVNSDEKAFELTDFSLSHTEKYPLLTIEHLAIPAHKLIVISGESGCGKSSFARCLAGLGEYQGKIFSRYSSQHIFYMTQETQVFDLSMEENIALNAGIADQKIRSVLLAAGISDTEYQKLSQRGIGENGVNISGGQKQRLGIARMLYFNAKVMIFDEPTSSLDEKSAKQVIHTLKTLSKEITCIVVSHDKTCIEQADIHFNIKDQRLIKMN